MSFLKELRERNVVKVGVIYVVTAWVLVQVASIALPTFEAPDWVLKVFIFFMLLGFPVALIMAWALELTPEGIKRAESSVGEKRMWTITGLLFVAAIAWFELAPTSEAPAVQQTVASESASGESAELVSEADPKSIAVLPFADFSSDRDFEWFTDGLTEEILNALARTPDLLVASRTSSFAYKGSDQPIADIAQELNVAHVLEGSVRRAGDTIRVTVQLIRASDGFHLWSENIDGSADDVINIQETVASEIARSLETAMDPEELEKMMETGTRSVRAYELYLQALALRDEMIRTGELSLRDEMFEKVQAALEEDPGFADAHASLANLWRGKASFNQKSNTGQVDSFETSMQRAMAAYENAIHHARNDVDRKRFEYELARLRGDWRAALQVLQEAEGMQPKDFHICHDIAKMHDLLGNKEASWQKMAGCVDMARDNPAVELEELADLVWQFGDPTSSLEFFEAGDAGRTTDVISAYSYQRAMLWAEEIERAAQYLLVVNDATPTFALLPKLRQACAEGRLDDAEGFYQELVDDEDNSFLAGDRWLAHSLMGRPEKAWPEFREYDTPSRAATFANFLLYPQFDPTPFPELMKLIRKNGGSVIPAVDEPFACYPRGGYPGDAKGAGA